MDTNELSKLCDQIFKEMADGWKEHNFSDRYYMQFGSEHHSLDYKAAVDLLKTKGLVEYQNLPRSRWGFTSLGQQEARRLLGL